MRIVSFIETHQRDVIEKIFRHCGLWEGPLRTLANPRAPPKRGTRPDGAEPRELQLSSIPNFSDFSGVSQPCRIEETKVSSRAPCHSGENTRQTAGKSEWISGSESPAYPHISREKLANSRWTARLRPSTVRNLVRSAPLADAQTDKQSGRSTKKPLAGGGQKCAKEQEILDIAPAEEVF
jgi:hypothetical protein